MKQSQIKGKLNTNKGLDDVLEKGKKILDYFNNNFSEMQSKGEVNYANPFSSNLITNGRPEDAIDSIDKINLLEYSIATERENAISEFAESNQNKDDFLINIKDFDNFILKIEDLVVLHEKTLSLLLSKQVLVYIECKVPLFRVNHENKDNTGELFYDTFNKSVSVSVSPSPSSNINMSNVNVFNLSHVSYHKLKLEEENFGVLANSKIELYLHKIDSKGGKGDTSDTIIGKGEVEFNKIFLSKDFFFTINLNILSYIENSTGSNPQLLTQDKKGVKTNVKKNNGRQSNLNKINTNTNSNIKNEFKEIVYKIGEVQISCQLFRSNLDREKDIKENITRNNRHNDYIENREQEEEVEYINNYNNENRNANPNNQNSLFNNNNNNNNNNNYEELKIDYDGILVLYLHIDKMKPGANSNTNSNIDLDKNYFISHKTFPNAEVSFSEIIWNTSTPDFNYQMLMPFSLNMKTIELLDSGMLIVEVWHKGNNENELLGTVKLELSPIIESLKIGEDTLSITPISKNLMPLIIYDGYQPVYNYEEFSNIFYLNLTMGLGTTTQVNNFVRKQNSCQKENKYKTENKNNIDFVFKENEKINTNTNKRIQNDNFDNNQSNQSNPNQNQNINRNQNQNNNEDDFQYINQILNEKENTQNKNNSSNDNNKDLQKYKERNADIDVEEILERNTKELENINSKYKVSMSSMGETKKYEGNPFLVTNNIKGVFHVSRESNFYINEKDNVTNNKDDNNEHDLIHDKLSDIDFFKTGNMQKIDNIKANSTIPDFKNLKLNNDDATNEYNNNSVENKDNEKDLEKENEKDFNNNKISEKIHPDKKNKNEAKLTLQNSPIENAPSLVTSSQNLKHTFEIWIDKLINLQIVSKLNGKAFIKYKFLENSSSTNSSLDYSVQSDTLLYSSYDNSHSIIDVDMKTSHSLILSPVEKIKDFLHDFILVLAYVPTDHCEEIIFGKVSLPCEELISVLSGNEAGSGLRELNSTLFIYGTEKIKRQDCIIGKMKIIIKYENVCLFNSDNTNNNNNNNETGGNVLMERQIIYNRKIPKNASLIFKLNYFKYDDHFLEIFDLKSGVFYIEIDPFFDDKKFKKMFKKQKSVKKYNSLNGIFEEEFCFNILIESDLLEYLKNKYAKVNLVVYNKTHNFINSSGDFSSDSDNDNSTFKEVVGSSRIKLCEIISNTDFINRSFKIETNSGVVLGVVNMEIKLESNEQKIEGDNKTATKTKIGLNKCITQNKKLKLDNLKEIMKEKNEKNLDGKYYLVINLMSLIFDTLDFNKKFENGPSDEDKSNNIKDKFFLTYNFSKNNKKVSPIYDKSDYTKNTQITEQPSISIFNLNFIEIIDFTISSSINNSNKEDMIKSLMENIFEVKLFINRVDENEHVGSFMIDIGKIFMPQCKLTKDANIYYSDICNIDFFNMVTKSVENFKLSSSFTLFKSDLSNLKFKSFYFNTHQSISKKDNFELIRSFCFKKENSNTIQNSNTIPNSNPNSKKALINFLNFPNAERNIYEYIDTSLINLEDDNCEILLDNLFKFLKIFNGVNFNSDLIEYNEVINDMLRGKLNILNKLNIKKTRNGQGSNLNKYMLSKEKIVNLFISKAYNKENSNNENEKIISEIINCYYNEEIIFTNKIQFGVYNTDTDTNSNNYNSNNNSNFNLNNNSNNNYNDPNDKKIDLLKLLPHLLNNTSISLDDINHNYNLPMSSVSASDKSKYKNKNKNKNKCKQSIFSPDSQATLTILIYSASNITLNKLLNSSSKPNCYFTFTWGDDTFKSEVVIRTSHPSWNQKLEIKFDSSQIKEKFDNDIIICVYSISMEQDMNDLERKSFMSYMYNSNKGCNNRDEFIGEVRVSIKDIVQFKFLNEKGEYEDFFNVLNDERVRGQLNAIFICDEEIIRSFNYYYNNEVARENNNNNNNINNLCFNSKSDFNSNSNYNSNYNSNTNIRNSNSSTNYANNYNFNKTSNLHNLNHYSNYNNNQIPDNTIQNKKYQFDDFNNCDTELLWEKLNKNTETIEKLTNEINLDKYYDKDKYKDNDKDYDNESKIKFGSINLANFNSKTLTPLSKNFNSTIDRERRITEKQSEQDMVNHTDIDILDMELYDLPNNKSKLETENYEINENIEKINVNNSKIIKPNNYENNFSMKSFNMDADVLEKPYSDFRHNLDLEELGRREEKNNLSMFENLKKHSRGNSKIKKPPIPALNRLYQNADKQFLNRIQNILKNKESKKLNYASSEESN